MGPICRMIIAACLCAMSVVMGAMTLPAAAREWVDVTGRFRIEAEFVKMENDVVLLKVKDGKAIEVPLNRLGEDDRIFARQQVPVSFTTHIKPILESRCINCHGPDDQQSGLRLDTRGFALKGGDGGEALVPGNPDDSLMYLYCDLPADDSSRMPATGEPLSREELDLMRRWIEAGGRWTGGMLRARSGGGGTAAGGYVQMQGTTTFVYTKDKTSLEIDEHIVRHLKSEKITPAPIVNDETFLRRAYLDIVGRIPTYDEAVAFLSSDDPLKREELIDSLLDSPGYESHMYNFWASDMLRLQYDRRDPTHRYAYWLKDSIAENKPYDKMVRELLTATGNPGKNGAVGYHFRDSEDPLVNTSLTAQVFLGTQIGCAQCHDHKFDKWTQLQFYQLAAFQGSVKVTRDYALLDEIREAAENRGLALPDNANNQLLFQSLYEVQDSTRQVLKFPDDYAYNNAQPGQVVLMAFLFPKPRVLINQLWVNPTALKKWREAQERTMAIRQYQPKERDATPTMGMQSMSGADQSDFSGFPPAPGGVTTDPKRLAFAQWITSRENFRFCTVIANRLWKRVMKTGLVEPIDDFKDDTRPVDQRLLAYLANEFKKDFDIKEFLRALYKTKTYHRLAMGDADLVAGSYHMQARPLQRMTAEQVYDSWVSLIVEEPDTKLREPGELETAWVQFLKGPITPEAAAAKLAKLTDKGSNMQALNPRPWDRRDAELVRASELLYPQKVGTMLAFFGQSPRIGLHGNSEDPSVEQVLYMLNGDMVDRVLGPDSVLQHNLSQASTPEEQLDVLFLSILTRYPTAEEQEVCVAEIRDVPHVGLINVTRALLNSREFLYIQ